MKKIIFASVMAFVFSANVMAAETVVKNEQAAVNNQSLPNTSEAQLNEKMAECHKVMETCHNAMSGMTSQKRTVAKSTKEMNEHERAALRHEFVDDNTAPIHEQMAERHYKQAERAASK